MGPVHGYHIPSVRALTIAGTNTWRDNHQILHLEMGLPFEVSKHRSKSVIHDLSCGYLVCLQHASR